MTTPTSDLLQTQHCQCFKHGDFEDIPHITHALYLLTQDGGDLLKFAQQRMLKSRHRTLEITMSKFFDELMESVQQMDEIVRGERRPSREFRVDALQVKEIRKATGLTQARFAALIDVQLGTLRNWEQGRREPTGPAKALLKAIHNDPIHVLNALAG